MRKENTKLKVPYILILIITALVVGYFCPHSLGKHLDGATRFEVKIIKTVNEYDSEGGYTMNVDDSDLISIQTSETNGKELSEMLSSLKYHYLLRDITYKISGSVSLKSSDEQVVISAYDEKDDYICNIRLDESGEAMLNYYDGHEFHDQVVRVGYFGKTTKLLEEIKDKL